MNDATAQPQQQLDPRQELFRYTDLSHPAILVLFNLTHRDGSNSIA